MENMGTKLEIGTYKNVGKNFIPSGEKTLVAVLPDSQGVYDTDFGRVGIEFSCNTERNYRFVELQIGEVKALQTRAHREKRKVNVSNEGKGQVQLARGRILFVTTDAFERR